MACISTLRSRAQLRGPASAFRFWGGGGESGVRGLSLRTSVRDPGSPSSANGAYLVLDDLLRGQRLTKNKSQA